MAIAEARGKINVVKPPKKNNKNANDKPQTPIFPKTAAKQNCSPTMPLNKYIAHCGICSRRDAADLVKQGKVSVNGKIITEPGFKVADRRYRKVEW